jgi:hypothetical protein
MRRSLSCFAIGRPMADFEVMPIGTRAAIVEAAALAREMEAIHVRRLDRAASRGSNGLAHAAKAQRHGEMATKLEAIIR